MRKLALLAALVIAAPAYATNGMRMIGFGPVQNSMGGVGVGATLDGASVGTNPAGLTELGRRTDLGAEYFKPTVSYSATGSAPQQFVGQDGATLDSSRGASPIPALSVVTPLGEGLVTGVGVFGTAGMGVDYAANLYGGPTYTSYLQGRLAPGAAYKVNDWLSAGATVNVMMAQMKYNVAAGFGQQVHDTATSFGIGATVGVKVTPVKMLSIGAAYETKSWFQDFTFNVPEHGTRDPSTGNPITIPAGKDKLTFDQPQSVTFGVAVTPVDMLLLAADVSWINWSSTMGANLPKFSQAQPDTLPFNMSWSDQWVMKIGAQVSPIPSLQLRAGYNYGKMPLDPNRAFENVAFPAVSEHHITGGAGYAFTPALTVNVAVMYALNSKLSGANAAFPSPDGTGGQGIQAYTSQMSQFELDAGVAYRF
jgi:long-chain fatty acid transport protein